MLDQRYQQTPESKSWIIHNLFYTDVIDPPYILQEGKKKHYRRRGVSKKKEVWLSNTGDGVAEHSPISSSQATLLKHVTTASGSNVQGVHFHNALYMHHSTKRVQPFARVSIKSCYIRSL